MKNIYPTLLFLMFLLMSCSPKEQDVPRISDQVYETISDSIYTRMPGSICHKNGIVYWEDPFSFENFMHAIDTQKKTEITAFANRGQGPNDFSQAVMFSTTEEGILVYDQNKSLKILYQIDRNEGSTSFSSGKYEHDSNVTRLIHLGKEKVLCHNPQGDQLFQIKENGSTYSFGKRPIKDEINNAFDIFQGQIDYHPQKGLLIYSSLNFPYIATYKNQGTKAWKLEKELAEAFDYSITEGRLRFTSNNKSGAMELALTKDHIVLLQRDTEVEEAVSDKEPGLSFKRLPHSLFVYDYNLELKKIINMPVPMLRLCGDHQTNTIYAMCVDPEFKLISIDIE